MLHIVISFVLYNFAFVFLIRVEYVNLYVDYVLNTSVARHFRAFKDAFHKVCGGRVLQLFHSYELMAVVIGIYYNFFK